MARKFERLYVKDLESAFLKVLDVDMHELSGNSISESYRNRLLKYFLAELRQCSLIVDTWE